MNALDSLLGQACIELGFCLSPKATCSITATRPQSVDELAQRIWRAEGLEDGSSPELFRRLCDLIRRFPRIDTMCVLDDNGNHIADVQVAPEYAPLVLGHVIGTFLPGPTFDVIAPLLEEMKRRHAADQMDPAFALSAQLDTENLTAIDDVGRSYPIFNLVFQNGGLLFSIAAPAVAQDTRAT